MRLIGKIIRRDLLQEPAPLNALIGSFLIVPLFVGQLNIKWARNSLFSERNGRVPTIRIGPIRLTWRRWYSAP
jgi:hypothetical protein